MCSHLSVLTPAGHLWLWTGRASAACSSCRSFLGLFFFYYFSLSLLVPPHLFLLYKEHCPSLSLCLRCPLCGCRVWCCVATGSLLWASAFCWSVCKPAQRVPPKSCGYREAEGLNLEAGCPPALTVPFVLFFFRRHKMILQIRLYQNRAGEGFL